MGGNYFHMDGIIFLISLFFASRFLAEEYARLAQVGGQATGWSLGRARSFFTPAGTDAAAPRSYLKAKSHFMEAVLSVFSSLEKIPFGSSDFPSGFCFSSRLGAFIYFFCCKTQSLLLTQRAAWLRVISRAQ